MHDTPEHEHENEIVATAKARAEAAAHVAAEKAKRWPLARIGLAAGIGSAAISAAVLYANRGANRNGGTKK